MKDSMLYYTQLDVLSIVDKTVQPGVLSINERMGIVRSVSKYVTKNFIPTSAYKNAINSYTLEVEKDKLPQKGDNVDIKT